MTTKRHNVLQSLFIVSIVFILSTCSFAYTMQEAGISQRAQDYVNTMQYSSNALNHVAFQNCLRDIISTETVPGGAVVITSEAQLSQIVSGGTYVIQGNLTFNNIFYPPSNVTIYVDGSIHRDGTFTAPGGVHSAENGSDAIFFISNKTDVHIIGVNNAQLTGNWVTGEPSEPSTTGIYIQNSNYITVEGLDIGYVWEGLVARGSNHHIYFLRNYVHDTRDRAIWILTSDDCEIVHNFVDNAGVDGIDYDAYSDDNISFENVVVGAGRWCGFVEEGAKRNYFIRNVGVMAFFNNPNTGWQMGWADNGTSSGVYSNGGFTENNYFIANMIIEPSQFTTTGGGNYFSKAGSSGHKGWTYFWGNDAYGCWHSTGDSWYLAEWLDTIPTAGGHTGTINGQQLLADLDAYYNPPTDNEPYSGTPASIPGIIEAEEYDIGGEGIAYHDTTAGNAGTEFRSEDVDIEARDGGYSVGWVDDGEWLEYTVDATTGTYDLTARVASTNAAASFTVSLDGTPIATVNVPDTTDWGIFDYVTVPDITITGGDDVILRIEFSCPSGGLNLNWIEFTQIPSSPYSGTPSSLPGKLQAEEYDLGGEGIAYHDTTAGNTGNDFRTDDVDITDQYGGHVLAWTNEEEWLKYTVNAAAGTYDITVRASTGITNRNVTLTLDGNVLGTINIPNMGWSTFGGVTLADIVIPATSSGILQLNFNGGLNVDWIDFTLLKGDVDFSGAVDSDDFYLLVSQWLTDCLVESVCADLDYSGKVDLSDFEILSAGWMMP